MSLVHDTIVTYGTKLPPSLGIFRRLEVLLAQSDCDLDDIIELVRVDAALAFQVIKLSNSALYGLKSRCESLDQAVARVGFGDIHQLVGLAVTRQTFQRELDQYDLAAGRLWENSIATGTLMGALARRAGADESVAYATGLLRNIGTVILNNYPGAQHYPGVVAQSDVHAWEQSVHGIAAPEVSAVLLDHWRFSPETIQAVRHHLVPEQGGELAVGAARLHLACALTAEWGCALPGEGRGWRMDAAMCQLAQVSQDDLAGLAQEARAKFNRCALIEWSNAA